MNPLLAALVIFVVFVLLCAGYGVLIILGTLVEWNQSGKGKKT